MKLLIASMKKNKKKYQDLEEQKEEDLENKKITSKYIYDLSWKDPENKVFVKTARNMFFQDYSYERIFLRTGVPPSIYTLLVKKWSKVKDRIDEKYLTKLRTKIVANEATDIMKKGSYIISLWMDRVIKRGSEMEAKDVKLTSDILANLHRIKQLEEGKPTDISMYEKMSPEEVMSYLTELQAQSAKKHDMSMFSSSDVPEEELLQEYLNNKKEDGDSSKLH